MVSTNSTILTVVVKVKASRDSSSDGVAPSAIELPLNTDSLSSTLSSAYAGVTPAYAAAYTSEKEIYRIIK